MVKVMDLPHRWEVWADPDGDRTAVCIPRFKRAGMTGWRHAFEVVDTEPRSRAVDIYQACKRWLDLADRNWHRPGAEAEYRAMDAAVMALGFSLRMVGRWEDSLRQVDHIPTGAF